MGYPIIERLIHNNRPRTPLNPQGVVIHSTATPGATAEAEADYFDRVNRHASAHYFIDWEHIIRTIPEDEVAWHAGQTANRKFLSVEMCEPAGFDMARFIRVWDRTVWLVADICIRYDITSNNIRSHREISAMWHETDHIDPEPFLSRFGRSWAQLISAIETEFSVLKNRPIQAAPVKNFPSIVLKTGDAGADVKYLQGLLNLAGANPQLIVDGIFGPCTISTVIEFQKAHGLIVDGIVGPQTWAALLAVSAA